MEQETDTNEKRVTQVDEESLVRLLRLAGASRDLVARSALLRLIDESGRGDLGQEFRERLLGDFATREDVTLAECLRIIENLVDEDELDDEDFVLDRESGVALVNAGLRAGGIDLRWARRVSWGEADPNDVRRLIDMSVERCVDASLVGFDAHREVRFWVEQAAPRAYPDPVERLEWLARALARNTHAFVVELGWSWFREIDRGHLRGLIRGLGALASIAQGEAFDPWGDPDGDLAAAWEAVRWSSAPPASLMSLLHEETRIAVAAAAGNQPGEGALVPLVRDVAPLVHPELVDRLLWFAEFVGKPAGSRPGSASRSTPRSPRSSVRGSTHFGLPSSTTSSPYFACFAAFPWVPASTSRMSTRALGRCARSFFMRSTMSKRDEGFEFRSCLSHRKRRRRRPSLREQREPDQFRPAMVTAAKAKYRAADASVVGSE